MTVSAADYDSGKAFRTSAASCSLITRSKGFASDKLQSGTEIIAPVCQPGLCRRVWRVARNCAWWSGFGAEYGA